MEGLREDGLTGSPSRLSFPFLDFSDMPISSLDPYF